MTQHEHVATVNEAKYVLMVRPCPDCGKGPWLVEDAEEPAEGGRPIRIRARCKHCGRREVFDFVCDSALGAEGSDAEIINPSDAPSRVIDLGQWLSLFYRLLERAAEEQTPAAERRLLGYRAALCLREALKFYREDDELPEETAFFTEASRRAFHEHPEGFARQKLLDMRAKLPNLGKMADRVKADRKRADRQWWQFWRS
jgi:hypothetical protein